jgi:hypothetical protein
MNKTVGRVPVADCHAKTTWMMEIELDQHMCEAFQLQGPLQKFIRHSFLTRVQDGRSNKHDGCGYND